MKYSELEEKMVMDKNGKKIGKIVRIDTLSSFGEEEVKFFAIIQIHHFFRKNHFFPMPLNSLVLSRVQEDILRLDITKEEFTRLVKQYDTDRKIKAKTADLAKPSDQEKALALSAWTRW
jgi:hypothetical protein